VSDQSFRQAIINIVLAFGLAIILALMFRLHNGQPPVMTLSYKGHQYVVVVDGGAYIHADSCPAKHY
jgi:hypothetical protein